MKTLSKEDLRKRMNICRCTDCGAEGMLTYIVTVQGGTRQYSPAAKWTKPHRCKACVTAQIENLHAQDIKQYGHKMYS